MISRSLARNAKRRETARFLVFETSERRCTSCPLRVSTFHVFATARRAAAIPRSDINAEYRDHRSGTIRSAECNHSEGWLSHTVTAIQVAALSARMTFRWIRDAVRKLPSTFVSKLRSRAIRSRSEKGKKKGKKKRRKEGTGLFIAPRGSDSARIPSIAKSRTRKRNEIRAVSRMSSLEMRSDLNCSTYRIGDDPEMLNSKNKFRIGRNICKRSAIAEVERGRMRLTPFALSRMHLSAL